MRNGVTFLQKSVILPPFFFLSSLLQLLQSPFLLDLSQASYPFYFPILTPYLCNSLRRTTGNAQPMHQAEVFSSPFYLADLSGDAGWAAATPEIQPHTEEETNQRLKSL